MPTEKQNSDIHAPTEGSLAAIVGQLLRRVDVLEKQNNMLRESSMELIGAIECCRVGMSQRGDYLKQAQKQLDLIIDELQPVEGGDDRGYIELLEVSKL